MYLNSWTGVNYQNAQYIPLMGDDIDIGTTLWYFYPLILLYR